MKITLDDLESFRKNKNKISRNAHLAMIRKLEDFPQRDSCEALVFAAQCGEKQEFFRLYEKFKPRIEWTDEYGTDLMGFAVGGLEIAIVEFLVQKGHPIDHPGRYQITPLMRACMQVRKRDQKKMQHIILYLLSLGVNTSSVDEFGHNALFYARNRGYSDELCSRLCPIELEAEPTKSENNKSENNLTKTY